jgi:hypothetical protein
MRILKALCLLLLLAGCAHRVEYTSLTPPANPKKVIEQVLTEQPQKYRPESVDVQDEFVQYGDGSFGKVSDFGNTRSRHNVVRLYYRSITENRLYQKGRWWIVQSRNNQGTLLATAWSDSEEHAKAYIAALDTMKSRDTSGTLQSFPVPQ